MQDDVRGRIRTELEETRLQFHRLLESLTKSDWDAPSCNPAWTNGQLLFHMAFAFILIPPLFCMIRFWSRRSRRSSHAFARALNSATPLFNWINALGPRVGARVYGRRRLGAKYDSVHIAILGKLDSVQDVEWDQGMYYPRRWDPSFGEFMTFEQLFHYPVAHFSHHQRHLSAGAGGKC
jgi:DinB superfamily